MMKCHCLAIGLALFAASSKRETDDVQRMMGALLTEVEETLEPAETERLESVQAKWRDYRDGHCQWQAAFSEGGSIQPTLYSTCITDLTLRRIEELKINLCEGQGMTGPCEASRRYDRPGLTNR